MSYHKKSTLRKYINKQLIYGQAINLCAEAVYIFLFVLLIVLYQWNHNFIKILMFHP